MDKIVEFIQDNLNNAEIAEVVRKRQGFSGFFNAIKLHL